MRKRGPSVAVLFIALVIVDELTLAFIVLVLAFIIGGGTSYQTPEEEDVEEELGF